VEVAVAARIEVVLDGRVAESIIGENLGGVEEKGGRKEATG